MNYRHIFHAGNRCDVVKHALLTLALRHLHAKDGAFAVCDTHAGIGFYDLKDPRAQKTGESAQGIISLLNAPALPALADFTAVLRIMNPLWDGKSAEGFRVYPGSPFFAYHMLRKQDRLAACEKHPEDAETLRLQAPKDRRFQIHFRDGFEALHAFLPPPEKRGLVLIDPPYEEPDEFAEVVKNVAKAYRRWPGGIFMIWYPVKDRPAIWQFHEALANSGIPKILCAEFIYHEDIRADRLNGCGMIVINPPWKLGKEISALFPALHEALKTEYKGIVLKQIAGEKS